MPAPPLGGSVLIGSSLGIFITYCFARWSKGRTATWICWCLRIPHAEDFADFKAKVLSKYSGPPPAERAQLTPDTAVALLAAVHEWSSKTAEASVAKDLSNSLRLIIQACNAPPSPEVRAVLALTAPPVPKPVLNAQSGDRLLTYVERIVDRQINKARGIITFDSILLVAVRYLSGQNGTSYASPNPLYTVSTQFLWISILLCLLLFWVHWGSAAPKADFEREFLETADLIRTRSILVQWALYLSILSVLGTLLPSVVWPVVLWLLTAIQ